MAIMFKSDIGLSSYYLKQMVEVA